MKKIIKISFARFLSASGIFRILQSTRQRRHVILTFHRVRESETLHDSFDTCPSVTVNMFHEILLYLKDHFKIVSLKTLHENSHSSDPLASITFDDGWRDNYDFAFPIIKELNVPATIFVVTGKIGSTDLFWQQKLAEFFKVISIVKDKDEQYTLKTSIDLNTALPIDEATYKTTVKKWKELNFATIQNYIATMNYYNDTSENPRLFLSSAEIQEMARFGIQFGSHTVNHVILTRECEDTVKSELLESKKTLQKIIAKEVAMLSYPDGSHSDRVAEIARTLGYRIACTTAGGRVGERTDQMRLPRLDPDWDQVSDIYDRFSKYMLQWAIK